MDAASPTSEELIAPFDFSAHPEYTHEYLVAFDAPNVGFSIVREYPKDRNMLFRPAVRKKDGKPATVCLLRVAALASDERENTGGPEPITVLADAHVLYLRDHFDYDYNDENCATEESIEEQKRSVSPAHLISDGEYFYDRQEAVFKDAGGATLTGIQLLDRVFEEHCGTARRWAGLLFRTKVNVNRGTERTVWWSISFLQWALGFFFGKTLRDDHEAATGILDPYPSEALVRTRENTIEFHGVKVPHRTLVTFSLSVVLVVLVFSCWGEIPLWLARMISFPLVDLCLGIAGLFFLDVVVPKAMLVLVNKLIRLRAKCLFRKFKV